MSDVLSVSVLVLNKYYNPVNITNAKRAFCMLFNKAAEVITFENESYYNYDFNSWAEVSAFRRELEGNQEHDWVHTPNLTLLVPRVVRVLNYEKVSAQKIKLTRKNIYYRDENTCQYCGKRYKIRDLNIDHVKPRSRGGGDTWSNLVCACIDCNIRKGNRLPQEAGMKLIRKPTIPNLNPVIRMHIGKKKYASWKKFLDEAYWNIELNGE